MIRTFNFWFIVAPATLFVAVMLAIFSVTEKDCAVKKRGSDKLWRGIMTAYGYITWITLVAMLFLESFRGILEFCGRDTEYVELFAGCVILGVPAIWGVLVFEVSMFVRDFRYKYVDYACKHGLSKGDRIRRDRANQKKRDSAKEAKKRLKRLKGGKLYVVPSSMPTQSTVHAVKAVSAVNFRLEQRIREYRIEERTDLNSTFLDAEGTHPISELLPEGVDKYYVAINVKNEEENLTFLGWENAEANLRRFVIELLEIEDAEEGAVAANS